MPRFRPILPIVNTPGWNLAKFLIPILEPLTHNKCTIKDSFSFAKEITTYDSSLYMASLDVEFSRNFYKQQPANHLLFLITCFINKLTEWQCVLLWVLTLQMHFYAIMKKNGSIIVQFTLNLWYTKGMLTIFFSLLIWRTPPTVCGLYQW